MYSFCVCNLFQHGYFSSCTDAFNTTAVLLLLLKGFHKENESKTHSTVWGHFGPFNSHWNTKAHSETPHY